jgi:FMN phosphatase YigB (HAD superfamily)
MLSTKKRSVKACAFDLGNTLINDTQLARDTIVDMGEWLLNQSLIQSRETFGAIFERVNQDIKQPFISHTFGELDFFEKTFEELAINDISAEEALKKYREILMQKIHPNRDIVDTFQLLKERNIRIALLSNESVIRVDSYMEKTNLNHFSLFLKVWESKNLIFAFFRKH